MVKTLFVMNEGQPFKKKVFDLQKCMKCVLSKGLFLRQGINIPVCEIEGT